MGHHCPTWWNGCFHQKYLKIELNTTYSSSYMTILTHLMKNTFLIYIFFLLIYQCLKYYAFIYVSLCNLTMNLSIIFFKSIIHFFLYFFVFYMLPHIHVCTFLFLFIHLCIFAFCYYLLIIKFMGCFIKFLKFFNRIFNL